MRCGLRFQNCVTIKGGAQMAKGISKTTGRLKKGYKFKKGGAVVKVKAATAKRRKRR